MSTLHAFGANDLKGVRRDPALFYMLVIPPLMIPAARFLLPPAAAYLSEDFGFDLVIYYPLLLSFFFVLQIPMLFGVLVGLLVLDEKDDDTLSALRVTPISMTGYALYRGAAAVLLSALYVCIALPLTGLLPSPLVPTTVPIALLSGMTAPVFALLLAALARNKVEGLALMKALSVLMLGPLAAYFVGLHWQLVFGVLPTYWPAQAFWVAAEGGTYWPYILVGLAYNLALTGLLLKRFRAKVF
jgi:fluoroquinolone transport system permease protein